MGNYRDFLRAKDYTKSNEKDQQQAFLETLIDSNIKPKRILDACCGGGALTYHIKHIYTKAHFELVDYSENAIQCAKELNKGDDKINYRQSSLYDIGFADNLFDVAFCWKTLSFIDEPEKMLKELLRVTNGTVYVSLLYNFHHPVDIYSKVFDYSNPQPECQYNTFCNVTLDKWLEGYKYRIYEFVPQHPITAIKELDTYTVDVNEGLLQIAGGMLLNWGVLIINK